MATFFWGKVFCAAFGYMFAGPLGLIVGLIVGYFIDKNSREAAESGRFKLQKVFFDTLFLIMGYIAKSDGRVSKKEIKVAEAIMHQLGLSSVRRKDAIDLFNQGKRAAFSLNYVIDVFHNKYKHDIHISKLFIEIQLQMAYANGFAGINAKNILNQIASKLGIKQINFKYYDTIFSQQSSRQDYSYKQEHAKSKQTQTVKSEIAMAYEVLSIDKTATDAEVKKSYRKLMSQHHPDKLISKGLPEDMLKFATEKTQKIKAAYEVIRKSRGM
jgi:DnaJ like chaperone protein